MKRIVVFRVCAVALILSCLAIFVVHRALQQMKCAQADSTARAIAAALLDEASNPQVNQVLGELRTEWVTLTDSQYDELIHILAPNHQLDAPKGWHPDQLLADPWGKRFVVRIRKGSAGMDVTVSSSAK